MKRRTIRKRRVLKKISYKRRGRQVGGDGDNDIRDILNKIPLQVFIARMTQTMVTPYGVKHTQGELTLQTIMPHFNTASALNNELRLLILLIGIVSYHLREKCTIIVKGGIAVQFLLAKHGCKQSYSTNDLDLFIQPVKTKYSARECANIISYFLVGALTHYVEGDVLANDNQNEENDKSNVVKISVQQTDGQTIKLVDIGYVQPSIFTNLWTASAIDKQGTEFRYYVPTIEVILVEKLRNLYLLREKPEPYQAFHYKQSAVKSLDSLLGCFTAYDKRLAIRYTLDTFDLSVDERKEAKDYFNSLLQ